MGFFLWFLLISVVLWIVLEILFSWSKGYFERHLSIKALKCKQKTTSINLQIKNFSFMFAKSYTYSLATYILIVNIV